MNIELDPRLFNPLYFHLKDAMENPDIRIIFLQGGSSSGKSFSFSQAAVTTALEERSNTLMMRKYAVDIQDSIYADVKGISEKINYITGNFYIIQNKICVGPAKIRFRGLDHSERIKGISQYKRVYLDEVTDFYEDDFKQIKKRLRGMPGQQIIASWNPISRNHWLNKNVILKEDWEDLPLELEDAPMVNGVNLSALNPEYSFKRINKAGNILYIKNTYRDNFWVVGHPAGPEYGFYDKHVIADFESDKVKDPNNYMIYANGEWGVISDRIIFKDWGIMDEIPEDAKRIPSGLDWGYSPDPATLTDFYVKGNTLYWDEIIHETGLTVVEPEDSNPLQFTIKDRLEDCLFDPEHLIIADSASPLNITSLRNSNYNVRGVKKPKIKDSLQVLMSYRHKITRRSKNIINEFENYQRQIDRNGTILPEPIDDFNHHIDPARYVASMKGRMW